jgi:hypothetical protein
MVEIIKYLYWKNLFNKIIYKNKNAMKKILAILLLLVTFTSCDSLAIVPYYSPQYNSYPYQYTYPYQTIYTYPVYPVYKKPVYTNYNYRYNNHNHHNNGNRNGGHRGGRR